MLLCFPLWFLVYIVVSKYGECVVDTANDVSTTVNAQDWVTRVQNLIVNVEVRSDIARINME